LRYVDAYALTKDFLERMGQMYARRGMTVTALRFHWILTDEEVRQLLREEISEADEARNLWGYVGLQDAARAGIAALTPREADAAYQVLLVASDTTRVNTPIEHLLRRWCPDTELRAPLTGTQGAFDCSRAARTIGWHAGPDWRDHP